MITFNKLWETMKAKGITTYKLRAQYGVEPHTIQRLKENKNTTTNTLNHLCSILDCKLEDIATYIKDEEKE